MRLSLYPLSCYPIFGVDCSAPPSGIDNSGGYIHLVLYNVVFILLHWLIVLLYFHAELPQENATNGYIFIHAEGGLNQQRIAVWVVLSIVIHSSLDCFPVLKFRVFHFVAHFLLRCHHYLVDWYNLDREFSFLLSNMWALCALNWLI